MKKQILILVFALILFSLGNINAARMDLGVEQGLEYFKNALNNPEEPSFFIPDWFFHAYEACTADCLMDNVDCEMGCAFDEYGSPEYNNCMQLCNSAWSGCQRGCGQGYEAACNYFHLFPFF